MSRTTPSPDPRFGRDEASTIAAPQLGDGVGSLEAVLRRSHVVKSRRVNKQVRAGSFRGETAYCLGVILVSENIEHREGRMYGESYRGALYTHWHSSGSPML